MLLVMTLKRLPGRFPEPVLVDVLLMPPKERLEVLAIVSKKLRMPVYLQISLLGQRQSRAYYYS